MDEIDEGDGLDWTRIPPQESGADQPVGQAPIPSTVGAGGRFWLEAQVARGGSGYIFRARDTVLSCPAAVKIIRADGPRPSDGDLERPPTEMLFRDPCLVQVRDRGEWEGGVWIAMEWVEGFDLRRALIVRHPGLDLDDWTRSSSTAAETGAGHEQSGGHGERRPLVAEDIADLVLIRALYEIGLTIGAAHRQSVVHLDLKPDNIMLQTPERGSMARPEPAGVWSDSDSGVQRWKPRLIDWGLSRRVEGRGMPSSGSAAPQSPPGAPAYMAPERANGSLSGIQPTADVYALGAILYHILTGERPYGDRPRAEVLTLLRDGRPVPDPAPRVDPDLIEFCGVCRAAMAPDPAKRPPDGHAFARMLRRAQGRRLLRSAQPLLARAHDARTEAADFDRQAVALLHGADGDEDVRHRGWALEDRAVERRTEAARREAQWFQKARDVVVVSSELPEGWAALIDWHCEQLRSAEARGDARSALLSLESLRADLRILETRVPGPLSAAVQETLRRARRLEEGTATLTLRTSPAAQIHIARQVPLHRRLSVGEYRLAGTGRLDAYPLEFGRIVVRLTAPGHATVTYPLRLRRGEGWGLEHPDGHGTQPPMPLPRADDVSEAEAYIASGWCWIGGERFGGDAPSPGRRVWVDGFIAQRNPVTHGDWIRFLDALVASGHTDEALARVPGRRAPMRRPPTMPQYTLEKRRFRLTDDGGTVGKPAPANDAFRRWPVAGISWHDAVRYAEWRSRETGLRWRLPSEWEFEKAARCNDDRRLPWGDHLEPEWVHPEGTSKLLLPSPVETATVDETIHRVRWMVSNCLTWCLDGFSLDGPEPDSRLDLVAVCRAAANSELRVMRGCSYFTPKELVSASTRFAADPEDRPTAGVRLVRSWPVPAVRCTLDPKETDDADPGQ